MNDSELKDFVQKFGKKKAEFMLSAIGKDQGFIDAIQKPIGKELLGGWLDDWKSLLSLIVNGQASEEERVEFVVVDRKLTEAAKRIAHYYQIKMRVDNAMSQ